MDGSLSWRASLAKSNINILNLTWNDGRTVVNIFFEFMYHPKPGQTKWCKTWAQAAGDVVSQTDGTEVQCEVSGWDIEHTLRTMALELRKELEG